MSNEKQGIMFLVLSQIIWGLNPLAMKSVSNSLPTPLLISIRFLMATVLFSVFILFQKSLYASLKNISKKNILMIIILGLIGSGLADLFFVAALRNTGVITSTLLARLEIPIGVVLAATYLQETLNRRSIIATILSFLGVLLISITPGVELSFNSFILGVIFGIIAAFLWAYAGILAKQILNKNVSAFIVTYIRLMTGGLFNLILSIVVYKNITPFLTELSTRDWLLLSYVGIIASAGAFFFYYKGMESIEASRTSIFLSLSIVIALLSGIFDGEKLTSIQWLGVGIILFSIYLVSITRNIRNNQGQTEITETC